MDRVLHFVLALAVVAILALLVSSDRKKIRIRYVIQLLVIEVLLAWFFLNSDVGLGFVKGFSEMFEKLLGFANEGTNFVFGSMNDQGLAFFFLKVLCPIVFISALIGILHRPGRCCRQWLSRWANLPGSVCRRGIRVDAA